MAKKNIVTLMGFVNEILSEDKRMFSIQIKKNERKFVYPIIELTEECIESSSLIEVGKAVVIEGKITTIPKENKYPCPNENCNEEISNRYIFTLVSATKCHVVSTETNDPYLNKVVLLGTVCREKDFRYIDGTKSPVGHSKYQIAVNRRMPMQSDYPWIATFSRQAEEDARRIDVGSQILVDGIINTRLNTKECVCSKCNSTLEITEAHTEVVGLTVEYLNNCIFPKNE